MESKINRRTVRFLIFWTIALLFELPFVHSILTGTATHLSNHFESVMAVHFMAAVTLFFSFEKGADWFDVQRKWPKLFFCLTLFLPFFGILLCLILYFLGPDSVSTEALFAEDEIFLSGKDQFSKTEKPLLITKKISESMDFVPLSDILTSGDIDLKRGAIEKLSMLGTPEAILTLMSQRSDPVPEVRFYATSALTRIKKNFDEKLEAAKLEMKKNIYKISARVFLAKIYIEYSRSNLIDNMAAASYLTEAITHLNFVLASEHVTEEALDLLLDIHDSKRNWTEALAVMEKKVQLGFDSPHDLIKLRLKYYFYTRQTLKFIEELQKLKTLSGIESDWLAMANWWGVSTP